MRSYSMHSGKQQAKHYAGPTWEAADGSKVVGSAVAHDDGPDHEAVPWLLLTATNNSGSGLFGNVRAIQRLHTVGGKAPAAALRRRQRQPDRARGLFAPTTTSIPTAPRIASHEFAGDRRIRFEEGARRGIFSAARKADRRQSEAMHLESLHRCIGQSSPPANGPAKSANGRSRIPRRNTVRSSKA